MHLCEQLPQIVVGSASHENLLVSRTERKANELYSNARLRGIPGYLTVFQVAL